MKIQKNRPLKGHRRDKDGQPEQKPEQQSEPAEQKPEQQPESAEQKPEQPEQQSESAEQTPEQQRTVITVS